MKMRKRAVLFDMDGVLLDSERLHMDAARKVLRPFKVEIPEHLRLEFMGLSESEYWERLREKFPQLPLPEVLAKKKNKAFWDVIKTRKYSAFWGAEEILKWLKTYGTRLAVVSSTPTSQTEYILKRISLFDFFDLVIGGDLIEKGKPSPEIYHYTAETLGLKPNECIVIEDSKNGITAGMRAGMSVIAMRPTKNAKGIAQIEVFDFEALRRALEKLLG